MVDNNKIVIFGSPRTGTKLLADVYKQQGYHNFGEFLNTFSCAINRDNIPYAYRIPISAQREIRDKRAYRGTYIDNWYHGKEVRDRINLLKGFNDVSPSTLTIWMATFDYTPEILDDYLRDRFFLCTSRKNEYEQMLSRLVTLAHLNHDCEIESTPVEVNLNMLNHAFYVNRRIQKLQEYIVNSGRGKFVDFDQLINGTADLGFSYQVTTSDQHNDLQKLILNIDEVNERFNLLKSIYV